MSKYSTAHTVYKNDKNEEVPSVTTVLKILNKPSLVYWANYLGFKRINVKNELKDTAAIGTDFHDMVSKYTTGEAINGEHLNVAIELFLKFKGWALENKYDVLYSEKSLNCSKFGGTIDSIGYVDGTLCMVDYKTSKNIYPSMFLQLAGYSLLVKENMPDEYKKLEKFGILSVSVKNGIQSKFITKKDMEKYYVPIFKKALDLFHQWYDLNKDVYNVDITK